MQENAGMPSALPHSSIYSSWPPGTWESMRGVGLDARVKRINWLGHAGRVPKID